MSPWFVAGPSAFVNPIGKSLCYPIQMAMGLWPMASHLNLPPKAILYLAHWSLDLGPGAFKSWLDASLTAFGVPPAPHTAKWASGACQAWQLPWK